MIQRIFNVVILVVVCWNIFVINKVMDEANYTHNLVIRVSDLVISGSVATVELYKRILKLEAK